MVNYRRKRQSGEIMRLPKLATALRLSKRQRGGAIGAGIAMGMALPMLLGAAGKILPGIFGKGKRQTTTNNYGGGGGCQQPQPQY